MTTAHDFFRSPYHLLGLVIICAKVVLVPLVFDPTALIPFAQPKALLAHALGLVLAGALGASVIRFGRSIIPASRLHFPVLAFVAVYVLSALFALDRNVALFGAHDRSLGLATVVDNVLLYLGIVVFVRTRTDATAFATAIVLPVPLAIGYQLLQLAGGDPFPWASGFATIRPFATLGNAAVLATYLGTIASGSVAFALLEGALDRRRRLGLAAIATLCLFAMILTATRAAVLGFGAAALTLGLIVVLSHKATRRPRGVVIAGLGATLLVGAVGVLLTPVGRTLQDLLVSPAGVTEERTAGPQASVTGRLILYEVALKELLDRPLLGSGPDNYVVAFPRYRPDGSFAAFGSSNAPQTSPHSWLARVATDAGFLGILAFLGVLVTAVLRTLKAYSAIAGAGLVAATFFLATGLVSINDVGSEWSLWVAFGLVAVGTSGPALVEASGTGRAAETATTRDRRKRVGRAVRTPPRRGRDRIAAAIVTASLLLSLLPLRALDAARAAEQARLARGTGNTAVAISAAERAVSLDPERAEYWHGLGLGYVRARRGQDAVRAFERASELAPYQATYVTNLARAHLTLALAGDAAARARALEVARMAVAADPNNGETHFTLALVQFSLGLNSEAAIASERGLALHGSARDRFAYEVAARAYLELGRPADAERWVRMGLPRMSNTENGDARLLLVRALLVQGRRAEAVAELDILLGQHPQHAEALRLRAQLLSGS